MNDFPEWPVYELKFVASLFGYFSVYICHVEFAFSVVAFSSWILLFLLVVNVKRVITISDGNRKDS